MTSQTFFFLFIPIVGIVLLAVNLIFASHNPYEEKLGWNKRELAHDDKAPPVAILPDGARHEFDPEQNYVSWSMFAPKR